MSNILLDAALEYAARGWRVFPCVPGKKVPLTTRGFLDATTEADVIKEWWARWPTANVATATGHSAGQEPVSHAEPEWGTEGTESVRGLLVIDVDPRNDGTVPVGLPDTLSTLTGGGGYHFYYTYNPKDIHNESGNARAFRKTLSGGVDIKAEGGYVLLPPSVTESKYNWISANAGIVEAPDWLLEACLKPQRQYSGITSAFEGSDSQYSTSQGILAAEYGERPGDIFNRTATWEEILEPHGWTLVGESEDENEEGVTYIEQFWCRPGKIEGISATTNYGGSGLLYVFTTSSTFEAGRAYTKFSAYTNLSYGGDFSAAAAALALSGYGAEGSTSVIEQKEYSFEPAVSNDHFISRFIEYVSAQTDAPREYAEASALVLLSVASYRCRSSLAPYPGGLASNLYCVAPKTKILTADLEWVDAGAVREGEELVGFDEHNLSGQGQRRQLKVTKVVGKRLIRKECYRLVTADGRVVICSADHAWLVRTKQKPKWRTAEWLARNLKASHQVLAPFSAPWEARDTYEQGWLGGIIDGEGSLSRTQLHISQNEGKVLGRIRTVLNNLGVRWGETYNSTPSGKCRSINIGQRSEVAKLLGMCGSTRLNRRFWDQSRMGSRGLDAVSIISVEYVGEQDVVAIETDSHTFIAEGLASHNCALVGTTTRSRKSTVQRITADIMRSVMLPAVLPNRATTEALIKSLANRNGIASVWMPDEFGVTLAEIYSRDFMRGLEEMLLTVYGGEDYTYQRVLDSITIYRPHLSVLAAATPESISRAGVSALDSGLLPRFAVVFPDALPPARAVAEAPDLSAERRWLINHLNQILTWSNSNESITFSEDALTTLNNAEQVITNGNGARLPTMLYKVAALIAIGEGLSIVSKGHAESATDIVTRWKHGMEALVPIMFRHGTDQAFEQQLEYVYNIAKERGRTPRTDIANLVNVTKRRLDEIEQTLVDKGRIRVEMVNGNNKVWSTQQ